MGELLDRSVQHELLQRLAERYPQQAFMKDLPDFGGNVRAVNLAYLQEHGLISVNWYASMEGREPIAASINAHGLDFLADDGGLGAILGVVTIKLHDDSIRKLLIQKIEQASGEKSVKKRLIEKVKSLPSEGLEKITMAGLGSGLDHVPDLLRFLGRLL